EAALILHSMGTLFPFVWVFNFRDLAGPFKFFIPSFCVSNPSLYTLRFCELSVKIHHDGSFSRFLLVIIRTDLKKSLTRHISLLYALDLSCNGVYPWSHIQLTF